MSTNKEMMKVKEAEKFLKAYCDDNRIPYELAREQMKVFGMGFAMLCVMNPNAPKPNGLANSNNTIMMPTLWIRKNESGNLYAEETEYTNDYLIVLKGQ